jgi:hypothetical protein
VALQKLHEFLGLDLVELYLLASAQSPVETITKPRDLSREMSILQLRVFELLLQLSDFLLHGLLIGFKLFYALDVVLE